MSFLECCFFVSIYLSHVFQVDATNAESEPENVATDPDYEMEDEDEDTDQPKYNKSNFWQTLETGLRYGMSYSAIANLINSVLVDLGYEDESDFISPSKVQRLASKHYSKLATDHLETRGYTVIGNFRLL